MTSLAAGDGDGADRLGHAADGAEQAPEGAEQAEEDHQPDEIAGDVAALVEARADAVEERAQRHGREAEAAGALAHHGRHGRQQNGLYAAVAADIVALQPLDPGDLAIEADDLPEDVDDADQQHDEDAAVQRRVVQEGDVDLRPQQIGEAEDGDEPEHHPEKEPTGRTHAAPRAPLQA